MLNFYQYTRFKKYPVFGNSYNSFSVDVSDSTVNSQLLIKYFELYDFCKELRFINTFLIINLLF